MPSVETIYKETVRPLPVADQKRLADMILENVDSEPHASEIPDSSIVYLDTAPIIYSVEKYSGGGERGAHRCPCSS